MEVRFEDDDLDRLETDARFTAGLPPEVVRAFRLRVQQIRAAPDEREFRQRKSWHFEKLAPKKDGLYSVRLNGQFRLVFTFEGTGSAKVVVIHKVEDYH